MASASRWSLAAITDAIRFHIGQPETTRSRAADAATATRLWSLGEQVNNYCQGLRAKLNQLARAEGLTAKGGQIYLPWYRTSGTLTTTSGSSTAYLPQDFDGLIALRDVTNNLPIYCVNNPTRHFYEHIRKRPAGPPELLVMEGFFNNGGTWQRRVTIYPATLTGITPSLGIEYYRVPADMDESDPTNAYPDIDPRYQDVLIWGVSAEFMGMTHPSYDRFKGEENKIYMAMIREVFSE